MNFADVIDAMTATINISTVVGVLTYAVGGAVGLAFMWWGLRKSMETILLAFRRGRLAV